MFTPRCISSWSKNIQNLTTNSLLITKKALFYLNSLIGKAQETLKAISRPQSMRVAATCNRSGTWNDFYFCRCQGNKAIIIEVT